MHNVKGYCCIVCSCQRRVESLQATAHVDKSSYSEISSYTEHTFNLIHCCPGGVGSSEPHAYSTLSQSFTNKFLSLSDLIR